MEKNDEKKDAKKEEEKVTKKRDFIKKFNESLNSIAESLYDFRESMAESPFTDMALNANNVIGEALGGVPFDDKEEKKDAKKEEGSI